MDYTRLTTTDLDEVVAFVTSVVEQEWREHPIHAEKTVSKERWERILIDRQVYGLRTNGKLVAIFALEPQAQGTTYLGTVFVGTRRQGIGTQLLRVAQQLATDAGASALVACVSSWNTPSLSLFTKAGFSLYESVEDGWEPGGTLNYLRLAL